MYQLLETIKINNGTPENLEFHNRRMNRSLSDLFGIRKCFDLNAILKVPYKFCNGIVKCRIVYDTEIRETTFQPYAIRPVNSLRLVEDNEIDYRYKYADRSNLDVLFEKRGSCEDILIIKNGYVTDTYYANLVFRSANGDWLTPESCLLKGTRRTCLLEKNLIKEASIRVSDLTNFTEARLINAMIDICDTDGIPIENMVW
ncbi:MAG: aminotransferase class IV [Bacteroidales bacterium]|nr:aminotransferase class IV [Bacteroidales bacterium]